MPRLGLYEATQSVKRLRGRFNVRNALLVAAVVAGSVSAVGYHFLRYTGQINGDGMAPWLYAFGVLLTFGAAFIYMSFRYRKRPTSFIPVFWAPIAAGLVYLAAGYLVSQIGQPSLPDDLNLNVQLQGFDLDTGRPLTVATILKMNVITLFQAAFCFILLLRIRSLVNVRRTRTSERNWNILLGLMVFASLLVFMRSPRQGLNVIQSLALVPAVGMMVVNSFRMSWIVYLPFRDKLAVIGLSFLLLILLVSVGVMDEQLLGAFNFVPFSYTFVRFYSYPLSVFFTLSIIFGIIYCTTTILSLLFHLPTASAFQQKAGEVAAIHSLTELVGQVFEPDALYSTITAAPVEAGLADASWLLMTRATEAGVVPTVESTFRISPGRLREKIDVSALYSDIQSKRKPVILGSAPADHRISARPGEGIGSLVAIPLMARSELLGALMVTKEVTQGFEPDDVLALSVYCDQAALALDRAHLFEERLEKERLERELAIAREVQSKLLPQQIPCIRGLTIHASSTPAQEVGGDYYDFAVLDENRLAFVIADVSGKGTSAAFYMAVMQGIFSAVSAIADSPRAFLIAANEALVRVLEKNIFISVLYGVIDSEKETISIARAGHCPAATIDLDGRASLWRLDGMGLGLDPSGAIFAKSLVEETRRLSPGDVFVLYTDGVIESRSATGDEYGFDRILSVLEQNRHEDVDDLHGALIGDLDSFVENGAYGDDTTVVVIKWHGSAFMPSETMSRMLGTRTTTGE
ncbi:MAG: SpoIIE family protein phosphatase [Bacteroidetes bacterium]|nr:SpoIIE family protein phosphatase [Bacteroidota bacterium]